MGRPTLRRKVRKLGGAVSVFDFYKLEGEFLRSGRTPEDEAVMRAAYTASAPSWPTCSPDLAARWRARWGGGCVGSSEGLH